MNNNALSRLITTEYGSLEDDLPWYTEVVYVSQGWGTANEIEKMTVMELERWQRADHSEIDPSMWVEFADQFDRFRPVPKEGEAVVRATLLSVEQGCDDCGWDYSTRALLCTGSQHVLVRWASSQYAERLDMNAAVRADVVSMCDCWSEERTYELPRRILG